MVASELNLYISICQTGGAIYGLGFGLKIFEKYLYFTYSFEYNIAILQLEVLWLD
jgi:hypothetical protein